MLRLLAWTWRYETRGESGWRARHDARQGVLLAAWHGHLLPFTCYLRHRGMGVLVSEHRDGEIIARVLHALGYTTIRGSSTRGGARALIELVKVLKAGTSVCITPDGPKGPVHRFASGSTVAAQRAGVPITPMVATADRAWVLGSWDRFMIPKPFARVVLHFADPAMVRGTTPAEAASDAERFEAMMVTRDPDVSA